MKNSKQIEITQREFDLMSNEELKNFQRKESDENIFDLKYKIQKNYISSLFFIFISFMVLINNYMINYYFSIIPIIISIVFFIKIFNLKKKLKFKKISRRMLEIFYEMNNL